MYLTLELLEMTLKTSPIPTRKWKNSKDPVTERDRKRKESKQSVDRRIHYLWFHFMRLCLELERIGHVFEKKGGGGKVIHGKGNTVRVNRDVYVGWDLENLRGMKFNDWYYGIIKGICSLKRVLSTQGDLNTTHLLRSSMSSSST